MAETVRERVAEAICLADGHADPGDWPAALTEKWLTVYRDFADAALAALGLDDLDAAVERVAAVISYGYPHRHAEDNEAVRRTARDAIAALTTTGDRDG